MRKRSLALELDNIFKASGWQTTGANRGVFDTPPIGLVMQVHSKETTPYATGILQDALLSMGFNVEGGIKEQVAPGTIKLIIGHKPDSN